MNARTGNNHTARKVPRKPSATAKIDAVEVSVLDIVPARQRKIPSGKIPYGPAGSWIGRPVLVKICAEGVEGYGEIRPINPFVGEMAGSMYPVIRDFYAPLMIGRNVIEIESLLNACVTALPGHPSALAAIDIALHDVVGQLLGVPVHALLGGACRTEIDLEWSVGLMTEGEMVKEAAQAVERYGVGCVCVKVGPNGHEIADARIMSAVRREVGEQVVLGMDANTTYNTNGAINLARRLEDTRIGYFEQPVARTELQEMRRIRDVVTCAVFADEAIFTRNDAVRILKAGAADVLGLKFYKCGGLHRMREIAAIAAGGEIGVNCAGTTAGTYLEAIAAAHLAASIPNHMFGAEFIMGLPSVNGHDPVVENAPIDVVDGKCKVPMEPGLGVVVDQKAVKKLTLSRARIEKSGMKEHA